MPRTSDEIEGVLKVAWQCHPDDIDIPFEQGPRYNPIGFSLMQILESVKAELNNVFDFNVITLFSDSHNLADYEDSVVSIKGELQGDTFNVSDIERKK